MASWVHLIDGMPRCPLCDADGLNGGRVCEHPNTCGLCERWVHPGSMFIIKQVRLRPPLYPSEAVPRKTVVLCRRCVPPIPPPVRKAVLRRAAGCCEDCGERVSLEVHHLRYRREQWPGHPRNVRAIFGQEPSTTWRCCAAAVITAATSTTRVSTGRIPTRWPVTRQPE